MDIERLVTGLEAHCGDERSDPVGCVHGRRQSRRDHLEHLVRPGLREQQDRGSHTAAAQFDALLDQCHTDHRRTGVERRSRHGDCAVAIGIGLRDGAHRGRCRMRDQTFDIARDGAEVDHRLSRSHGFLSIGRRRARSGYGQHRRADRRQRVPVWARGARHRRGPMLRGSPPTTAPAREPAVRR